MINNNELINILKCCEREACELHHPFIGTEHFILAVLKSNDDTKNIFINEGITYKKYKEELLKLVRTTNNDSNLIYTPLLKKILFSSSGNLTIKNILFKILEEGEGIGISILNSFNVDICQLYSLLKDNNDSLYGEDLTSLARNNKLNKVIGRDKEINEIIEILGRKNKCNPLLIGEAGVGKTAIVEGLAIRIANKDVPYFLKNKSIISISMSSLVSGTKYRGEFEEKMEKLIKQLSSNPNRIIFIDEIHTLVGAGGAEGAIDASNIFKPYLARNSIRCIGSTTITEYNKSIKKDKALDRRFNKILIKEPSNKEVKTIMYGVKSEYEKYHNIKISNKEIDFIIDKMTVNNLKKEPDRSLDILDNVCAKASIYLRNDELTKLNRKLNDIINKKNDCIKKGEYKKAYIYKNEELNINYKIINYRPKITCKYISDVIRETKVSSLIGF